MQNGERFSATDFVSRQRHIRRGLVRSNTATGVVLLVTLLLAVAAVSYGLTAEKNAEAARAANRRERVELWNAQLAEATAWRLSSRAGPRTQGLEAIARAARLRPSIELRNEALATLPLTDTRSGGVNQAVAEPDIACAFAPGRGLLSWGDTGGRVRVRAWGGTNDLASFSLSNRLMAGQLVSQRPFSLGHRNTTSIACAGRATCVGLALRSADSWASSLFAAAYLEAFNPANPSQDYLGDLGNGVKGSEKSFSVAVPVGARFVVTNQATGATRFYHLQKP